MKKLLLILALCLLCAFTLTACNNDNPPVEDNPTSDNQNQDNNQNDDNQNDDNQNDDNQNDDNQNDVVVYSEGLAFTSNGDGTCSVSGIGNCTSTDIVIPAISPTGEIVVGIGNRAFSNDSMYGFTYKTITSISLPNTITTIGYGAFSYCDLITEIIIPDSVVEIGGNAFTLCTSLTSIEIPESVTSIGTAAFSGCSSLTSIEIPNSVTTIGSSAFWGCKSLTSIGISDSVITIGSSAFQYCTSLTIYCEATSEPSGWDYGWNSSNRPVVWGYKEN